jgi:hypothetical protein
MVQNKKTPHGCHAEHKYSFKKFSLGKIFLAFFCVVASSQISPHLFWLQM